MDQIPSSRKKRDRTSPNHIESTFSAQDLLAEADSMIESPQKRSTQYLHQQILKRYERIMSEFSINPWPSSPSKLKIYCAYLTKKGGKSGGPCTYRTLYTAVSPIYQYNWKHYGVALKEQFQPDFNLLLKSFANKHGSGTIKKKIFTDSDIGALFSNLESEIEDAQKKGNERRYLTLLRYRSMMSLQLAACLRVSELLNLKCNDLELSQDKVVIKLENTKTDTSKPTVQLFPMKYYCPIEYLKTYLKVSGLRTSYPGYLFRRLKKKPLKFVNKPISYSSYRLAISTSVKRIGLDPTEYGSHSFRRTAATNIIRNGGSALALKRHGRWTSHAVESYVELGSTMKEKASTLTFGDISSNL